jgi:hypothetical protein
MSRKAKSDQVDEPSGEEPETQFGGVNGAQVDTPAPTMRKPTSGM